MDVQDLSVTWPPSVGDYVRVRASGILGEIVETPRHDAGGLYTLNVFTPGVHDALIYRLEDLETVWRERSGVLVARQIQRRCPVYDDWRPHLADVLASASAN